MVENSGRAPVNRAMVETLQIVFFACIAFITTDDYWTVILKLLPLYSWVFSENLDDFCPNKPVTVVEYLPTTEGNHTFSSNVDMLCALKSVI